MNYYIVNGKLYSSDEISHGQNIRYIDLDPDVLVHWKYIKRVRLPNGKYRYYYDDRYLKKKAKEIENARLASIKESARAVNAQYSQAMAEISKDPIKYNKAKREEQDANEKAEKYSKMANRYVRQYEAMKVTAFAAKTIIKGLNAVSSLLHKLFGKKKK